MEIQMMREFSVLAQKLNFGRAAGVLGITQSTLSKHVMAMERELGFKLFERSTAAVELTRAGVIFLEESHEVLEAYDVAMARTRERLKDTPRTIIINGNVNHPTFTHALSCVMHSYHAEGRRFAIDQSREIYASIDDMLADDASDVFVLLNADSIDSERFEVTPLFRDGMSVLFPSEHPSAQCESVQLVELADEKVMIVMGSASYEDWYYLKELFARKGFFPRTKLLKFENVYGIINDVVYESRYFMPTSLVPLWPGIAPEHLVAVPISDADCVYEYCLVRRRSKAPDPEVDEFVARLAGEFSQGSCEPVASA